MKKLLVTTVAVFFLSTFYLNNYRSLQNWTEKEIKQLERTTVLVEIETEDGGYLGSGVIISKKGLVLTAAHVVDHENMTIYIIQHNDNIYQAEVVGIDTIKDLALIQILHSAQKFEYANIQKSNHLWTGQSILIIGHPVGHYWMISIGYITRIAFVLPYMCQMGETTVFVNPGSSGGPVFSEKGELIGIVVSMRVTWWGEAIGIGVFVPIKQINKFIKKMQPKLNEYKYPKPRYRIGDLK